MVSIKFLLGPVDEAALQEVGTAKSWSTATRANAMLVTKKCMLIDADKGKCIQ